MSEVKIESVIETLKARVPAWCYDAASRVLPGRAGEEAYLWLAADVIASCAPAPQSAATAKEVLYLQNLNAGYVAPVPATEQLRAAALRINGQTPMEFASDWYKAKEIHRAINDQLNGFDDTIRKIPRDVHSVEFAEWMANQYQLAMCKGMDIAHRALAALEAR